MQVKVAFLLLFLPFSLFLSLQYLRVTGDGDDDDADSADIACLPD